MREVVLVNGRCAGHVNKERAKGRKAGARHRQQRKERRDGGKGRKKVGTCA